MYKYILILSITFVSSVLTALNITPEITSNLIDIEQRKSEQQRSLELIAQNSDKNDTITEGQARDARGKHSNYKYSQNLRSQTI